MTEVLLTEGRDFSILDLVMDADPFVQAIMLLVVVCSVATWALIFEKMIRLVLLRCYVRAAPFPPVPESVGGPLKWSIPFNYR